MAKTYTSDARGLAELGRSAAVSAVAVAGARRIAETARAANPEGEYAVTPTTVTAGWANEARAGASVTETVPGRGPDNRVLANAAEGTRP